MASIILGPETLPSTSTNNLNKEQVIKDSPAKILGKSIKCTVRVDECSYGNVNSNIDVIAETNCAKLLVSLYDHHA